MLCLFSPVAFNGVIYYYWWSLHLSVVRASLFWIEDGPVLICIYGAEGILLRTMFSLLCIYLRMNTGDQNPWENVCVYWGWGTVEEFKIKMSKNWKLNQYNKMLVTKIKANKMHNEKYKLWKMILEMNTLNAMLLYM